MEHNAFNAKNAIKNNSKLRMPLVVSPEQEAHWLQKRSVVPFTDFEARPVH